MLVVTAATTLRTLHKISIVISRRHHQSLSQSNNDIYNIQGDLIYY